MLKVIGGAQEGEFKAVASGTLPNGKPVIVNADGTVSVVGGGNLTSENYIGMSSGGAVVDTASAKIDIIGAVNKNQSGLTSGQKYYVQTDGTIGLTAADPSVLAGTAISATSLVVKT